MERMVTKAKTATTAKMETTATTAKMATKGKDLKV